MKAISFFKETMDVKQRIAIGAMGLGYLIVRNVVPSATQLHETIASDAELLKWNRALSASLSEFIRVTSCDVGIKALIHEFRCQDQQSSRASSFHMNRLIPQITIELKRIVRNDVKAHNASVLRDSMYVEQDVVPAIQSHLESILHNHMLRSLM